MNSSSDRRGTLAASFGMAGLVAIAFAPVWTGQQSFYHLDTYFEHVPFWHFAATAVANGEWPWWTPNIRAGYPLHANGEASLLYPLTLPLGLALPAHRAADTFVLLHLVALGVFTERYFREIGIPAPLAFVGGAVFCLSGRMLASAIWPNAVAASAFLPLLLLGIERCRRGRARAEAIIALSVGLGLLAGRPQRFVPALLFAGAYALASAFAALRRAGPRPAGNLLARCLAATLVGVAIAAPQVLPTLSLLTDSVWAEGVSRKVFEFNSLHASSLAAVALPADVSSWPEARSYPGAFVYLGLGAAFAAGLCGRLRPRAGFFAAAVVGCFWIACAAPMAYEFCQAVPLLSSLRSPVRFLFPAAFAAVALAILGIHAWLERRPIPRVLGLAVAVLACAELVGISWRHAPTGPAWIYEVEPDVVAAYPDELDPVGFPYRFYASGHWVAPNVVDSASESQLLERFRALPLTRDLAMRFGGRSSSGYGEPKLAWKVESYKRLARNEVDQLGVKRLFMGHRLKTGGYAFEGRHGVSFVYANPTPMPRAICVSRLESAADARAALERAADPEFDPRIAATVERGVEASGRAAGRPARCGIRRLRETPTEIDLAVEAGDPGWLVLFDTWAPGWRARVDSTRVPIERANGMFRLVAVPAGTARVEFRYRPPGLLAGVVLSTLALTGCLVFARSGRRHVDADD